jgi:hypothetical protein
VLKPFRVFVSSCTCEGDIEVSSDGETISARCAECLAPRWIGRTSDERREKMIDDDMSGVAMERE